MLCFLTITTLLFTVNAYSTVNVETAVSNIVGGFKVNIEDYPYQVALVQYGRLWCGGSIITKLHVLSAAHCIYKASSSLTIHAGTSFWNNSASIHHVLNSVIYGHTDGTDISVLGVVEPFIFDAKHKPIPLFSPGKVVQVGTMATVTGWGYTEESKVSDQLMAVNVPIVDKKKCNESYSGVIVKSQICAGIVNKDSCRGDSGGPLVIHGYQIGIVTMGFGCGYEGYPGVYINVTYYYKWIMEQISK